MSTTDNILIAHIDYMQYTGAILSATGNWVIDEQNLISNDLGEIGRVDTLSTDLRVNLGAVKPTQVLALPKHNFSNKATWRVRASNNSSLLTDPTGTPLDQIIYDSASTAEQTTSNTSLNPAGAPTSMVVAANLNFFAGVFLEIVSTVNNDYITATVDSYNPLTSEVFFTKTGGSGSTASDWIVRRLPTNQYIWPISGGYGVSGWGDFQWNGDDDEFIYAKFPVKPPALLIFPNGGISARYFHISIADPTNTVTYLDISKIIVSPGWQPSVNMEKKWSIQYIDKSKRTFSKGSQLYVDSIPQFKQVSVTFSNLDKTEMFENLGEVDRQLGAGVPMLVVLDPNDTANLATLSIYGSQTTLTPIIEPYQDLTKKTLVIQEWI